LKKFAKGIDSTGTLVYVPAFVLRTSGDDGIMSTFMPTQGERERAWHLIDATDRPAGRLAVDIATFLRGKHRPDFAPHVDMGDFVVVVNAEKVKLTGAKEEKKIYTRYTGYPSGLKKTPAGRMRAHRPEYIIEHAVKGMLPKNRMGRHVLRRLKIYAGPEHPHQAQLRAEQATA
jgi:large subunit ribosomal protein L13